MTALDAQGLAWMIFVLGLRIVIFLGQVWYRLRPAA